MKNFKLIISFVVIPILIGMQAWFLYVSIRYPHLGINLIENGKGQWIIEKLDKESVSVRLGLEVGDVVTKINGNPPEKHFTVYKWRNIEQADTIEVSREGVPITFHVLAGKDIFTVTSFSYAGAVLSFFIAIILQKKIRTSKSAVYLSYVFFTIGITFTSLGASIRGDVLGKYIITVSMMLVPIVFLHFLIVFLKEKGEIQLPYRYVHYFYSLIILLSLLRITDIFVYSNYNIHQFSANVSILFFILGCLLNFIVLTYVYYKHRREASHFSIILKTIRFSLVISFAPLIFLSLLPLYLYKSEELVSSFYTSWFVLFFPLTFAYLIATKQLFDIHIVLRRVINTVIIALIPSLAIVLSTLLLFPDESSAQHLVIVFLLSLIVFSAILYSLEYLTTKLEAVLFPRKYYLHTALKKIAKNLEQISSFRDLRDIILVDIVNTLEVHGGAIVFQNPFSMETIKEGEIDTEEIERLIGSGVFEHPNYMFLEITSNEEHTSYLVMTRKKTNTRLGLEEIHWLNMIISYLAVSLENVHLIRKLTLRMEELAAQIPNASAGRELAWFRKLMFELQEKERMRIATDLHDTTMQDLFFLKHRLEALVDKYVASEEGKERGRNLMEYVDIINTNLRQSCFELYPYLLQEIGLVGTMRKVVEQEALICPFTIDFTAREVALIEEQDMETKRHLFRIFQELLNNAKKHSLAKNVQIHLITVSRYMMKLTYRDDGVGFEDKRQATRDIGQSGIGMEQLRSRVFHLNGQFELKTSRGKGVFIEITLPLRRMMSKQHA